eukprot:TRINITY_DN19993_c0_g1_i1.p1 TRINITY_DN19993_c0_g1~~TRINITY_DN19993_c0_g1_i1.p1  ORF type:complete len:377 (-),score=45.34 TRINITY_DN19993_c0_g1_i1:78-1208(-)
MASLTMLVRKCGTRAVKLSARVAAQTETCASRARCSSATSLQLRKSQSDFSDRTQCGPCLAVHKKEDIYSCLSANADSGLQRRSRPARWLSSIHSVGLRNIYELFEVGLPQQSRRPGIRHFHVASPVCMGRRSSKIAMRKGKEDAKKAKLYGKVGKQIISAVREGGPNPASNSALALLLTQARMYDIPKDILERNIKKASEKGQADFAEMTYEVYGIGGVGIVLDVLTDNNARAAATVRDVVKKSGGKMADPGSVMFNFQRCGVLAIPAEGTDADSLLLAAMDLGADDVEEPQPKDPDDEHEGPPRYRVVTTVESYLTVRSKLEEAGFQIDANNSGLELLPVAYVEPDEEAHDLNEAMIEKLLELDDVDAAYSNQK